MGQPTECANRVPPRPAAAVEPAPEANLAGKRGEGKVGEREVERLPSGWWAGQQERLGAPRLTAGPEREGAAR
jgi:hypothetical protein